MPRYAIPFWRAAPFTRLLAALVAGILTGYYLWPGRLCTLLLTGIAAVPLLLWNSLPPTAGYRWRELYGIACQLLLVCMGICLVHLKDTRYQRNWFGPFLPKCEAIEVVLEEPPAEKEKSFSTTGLVTAVWINNTWTPVKGYISLYFRKDSSAGKLEYGSTILLRKKPQSILNRGNPGGFDYRQYCSFRNTWHQLYLAAGEYRITGRRQTNPVRQWLFNTRKNILEVLRKQLKGKENIAFAEALLIGYRDDLDKKLVQAYSNTGVVHIIAISGLHLGMIYGLMLALLKPFHSKKCMRWIKPILLLSVLWGFSLLAGAAASVLRSTVMFSFIVIGECLGRRTEIYNTLAASAFCLLVYNPYFLWDAGFLLSYAAVLSIVVFRKPLCQCLQAENKLLQHIWQLNAITLSAQVFTLPIVLFYFHQFPNLFLFTNFFAVPVSGLILYAELFLLLVQGIAPLNRYTGHLITILIEQLNRLIERTDQLPFAITKGIQTDPLQTVFIYLLIIALATWWMKKKSSAFVIACIIFCSIAAVRSFTRLQQSRQHKLVVYQTPGLRSIDIVEGKRALFTGDDHRSVQPILTAARTRMGTEETKTLTHTLVSYPLIAGTSKTIWILNRFFVKPAGKNKIRADLLLLSGNPSVRITELYHVFDCREYVFDSSNPLWKIQNWKKEADSLHLRHHSVPEQGAYVTDL